MKTKTTKALDGEVLAADQGSPQGVIETIELNDLHEETREYAIRIGNNWRRVAASIIETGRAITEARKALKKKPAELDLLDGYIRTRLKIGDNARYKLELVGAKTVFTLEGNTEKLPAAVATLYKLTQLEDKDLKDALASDAISPATTMAEVNKRFFTPKAKKKKPVLTVSISGAPKNIPGDKLETLSSLLDEFEEFIPVKRNGF